MKFKCQICKKKGLKNEELKTHLKEQHNLSVKKYEQKLYDYSLVNDTDGSVVPLSFQENLEINYRLKIMKIDIANGMELNSKDGLIVIDFEDMTFAKEDGSSGKVTKEKSTTLKGNEEYPIWIVYLDDGPIFFG